MTQPTQWQHRQTSVQRFIPILQQLLTSPSGVTFDPSTLKIACETAVSRLRDAVNSIFLGHTVFPELDVTALRAVWPTFYVKHDGKHVYVLPRAGKHPMSQPLAVSLGDKQATPAVELNSDDQHFSKCLDASALLIGFRVLTGTVHIRGKVSKEMQQTLTGLYDVGWKVDGEETVMF